jgi:hypothetical protein
MIDELLHKARSLVRPIAGQRRLLERAKYLGTKILSPQEGNDFLAGSLQQPTASGRIGGTELRALRRYLSRANSSGHCESWGRDATRLYFLSGVYPVEPDVTSRFCRAYLEALSGIDVLAVWFNRGEHAVSSGFAPKATLTELTAAEPYFHERPWSQRLAGKTVLVVSAFTETIESQYRRRKQVWRAKPEVLPDFELVTLRCPIYSFLAPTPYPDWFAALDAMREQMAAKRFDVAIIGAGAWSLPLVVHAKSLGAWAIHLGGAVQLLFGINGDRWEKNSRIAALANEAWTRPSADETPSGVKKIEGGCYW